MGNWMVVVAAVAALGLGLFWMNGSAAEPRAPAKAYQVTKSEAEWKKLLTSEQYRILRQKGTERAFTGKYWKEKREGVYSCAACNQELFHSEHKFKSGTGWPSYYKAIAPGRVDTESDRTYGMVRTEILCSRCGSHLGHVFRDGPRPTGFALLRELGVLEVRA